MAEKETLNIIGGIYAVLMLIFPIWAVIRLRILGIFVGAVYCWLLELFIHPVIATLSPGGLWPFFTELWLFGGLFFSLAYVAIIYGLVWVGRIALFAWRKIFNYPICCSSIRTRKAWCSSIFTRGISSPPSN
jgi:hypothetical protein